MIYTGGECSVLVPREACVSGEVDCSLGVSVGSGALVSVPSEFCNVRSPSSASLAARLSQSIASPTGPSDFRSETLSEWWTALHPRWSGGHDVSGHVFLLTLSAVLLFGEVYPSLAQLHRSGYDLRRAGIRTYVALGGAFLVALWVFILSQYPSASFARLISHGLTSTLVLCCATCSPNVHLVPHRSREGDGLVRCWRGDRPRPVRRFVRLRTERTIKMCPGLCKTGRHGSYKVAADWRARGGVARIQTALRDETKVGRGSGAGSKEGGLQNGRS